MQQQPQQQPPKGNGYSTSPMVQGYATGQPIAMQPGAAPMPPGPIPPPQQMVVANPMEGVPRGLEYLTQIDNILIIQKLEIVEMLFNFECSNRYELRNANGQLAFFAAEITDGCALICCGPQRGFTIRILDNFSREVIRVSRPFKCFGGGLGGCYAGMGACQHELTVESPVGQVVGTVTQHQSFCSSAFYIADQQGNVIFDVSGPCCLATMGCHDKEYPINSLNGNPVATVTKVWGGTFREFFSDADIFRVDFPKDLDVKMKATLIGVAFLIDFMEYETKKDGHGVRGYY